jgi:hypothetical protein
MLFKSILVDISFFDKIEISLDFKSSKFTFFLIIFLENY